MKTNRFRFIVAALLVVAFAVASADPAAAFIRLGRQADAVSPVVQAHWLDSDLPLKSAVNSANNDIPPATALATVQACAQSWVDINTCYFTADVHEWGAPETAPDLEFDGQNSVFFDMAGVNFAPGGGVIAFVRSIVNLVDGQTLDADMVFNDRDFYSSVSSPGLTPAPAGQTSVDLQAVLTHEYGHYFGLDHTSVAGSTMIPFISNDISQRTLELDDRAGLSDVYPESAARGLSPGAVDFRATTGVISGTVLNGFNGSAIFGAHVEAINLAIPNAANSISTISGEYTLRNGQGDFSIRGLPPGNYAVRIVPLDGINTTAADANVGGVYNGLDIGYEPEFWNGASESANGFTDPPNSFEPVAVAAGATSGGIAFQTNTYPGRVLIAQHGSFENIVTFRNTGYLAVRFDPPFDPPYTISNVQFPSFTFNGIPAPFVSAKLCPMNPANGGPDIANAIFSQTPFNGNPNGINTVTLNYAVTDPGKTFFWVMQFPSQATPGFPNNFPFLRMDFTQLERGLFGNSYSVSLAGTPSISIDRNLAVDMTCQVPESEVPIVAPGSFGGNRRATQMEFSYRVPPTNTRADGFSLPANSLERTELVYRGVGADFSYSTKDSAGAGTNTFHYEPLPSSTVPTIWATQAIDKNGNRSLTSNVTIVGFNEDADEPNGRANEAKPLTTPVASRPESYSPAGDQDFYSVQAKPGDMIDASAASVGQDGNNNMDLVMFLFDNNGDLVAANDDFSGLNPRVTYVVPPPSGNSNSKAPRTYKILVSDITSSAFAPTAPPQVRTGQGYVLSANVTTPVSLAGRMGRTIDPNEFYFENSGPNPANPTAKFLYAIPKTVGAGSHVVMRIYDVSGRMIRTLVDGFQSAGPHSVIWDGKSDRGVGVSSGRYFARIQAGSWNSTTNVTILK
ncbi:MAG TPA: matrixin family metalloprotease [Candidatus Eisenbacteria bacterium]|nr:matrixin family metalloprotease [Candidatus Eisenbacteria bacterium]